MREMDFTRTCWGVGMWVGGELAERTQRPDSIWFHRGDQRPGGGNFPFDSRTELKARPPELVVTLKSPLSGSGRENLSTEVTVTQDQVTISKPASRVTELRFPCPRCDPGSVSRGLNQGRGRRGTIAKCHRPV